MLTVDDFELIRRSYYVEGKSQRQISRDLGHSRKTVGKALEHPAPPGYRRVANEKGDVENLANRSQRTYLTPVPEIVDLASLGAKLLADCDADLDRPAPAPHQARTRRALWAEEQAQLLPLPGTAFPACREQTGRVDSHALVHCDGNFYSVPVRWAGQACRSRICRTGRS
jgi:hypothetical protein